MEMYDVMSRIRDGTLQAGTDPGWVVRIRGGLGELYWIESRNGWLGDYLIDQRTRRPDRSTLMNPHIPSVFAGWHNLEALNVRIDMRPQFWVSVPTWCTVECERTLLVRSITPWIFT